MVKVGRILRDYAEAGAVNSLIALWGFVDEHTFLTKAGHVGVVYQMRGPDAEGLTHAQRQGLVHQFEAALRLLDEHCRVYQYVVKQTVEPFTAPSSARVVAQDALRRRTDVPERTPQRTVSSRPLPGTALRAPDHAQEQRVRATDVAVARCRTARSAVDDPHVRHARERTGAGSRYPAPQGPSARGATLRLRPSAIGPSGRFQFFRRLVNYDPATLAASTLTYDTHLDYFVADSAIECHRDRLTVGDQTVRVLSMKEPPSQTRAHALSDLVAVPGEFIACLEWQRTPSDRVRRDIQSRRRHFFNKRVSLVNYVSPETRPEEMLVDDSASATVRQLGDALTEVDVNGHFFGTCSLTVVLHGSDPRALHAHAAEAMKVLAAHDGSMFQETYNLLNAWLSIVPGNTRLQPAAAGASGDEPRRSQLPVYRRSWRAGQSAPESPGGSRCSRHRLRSPTPTTCTWTTWGTRLVLGATGSGKSFLLNFLVTHLQQYDPFTVVLDLGHSYRKLATLLARQLSGAGAARTGRDDQPIRPGRPDPGATALPPRLHEGAARGRGRVSTERSRGSGNVRSRREPVRPGSGPTPTLHPGQPAAAGARRAHAQVGGRRPLRGAVRQPARHADTGSTAGVRLRVHAGVPLASRTVAVLRAPPRERAGSRSERGRHVEGLRHGRGVAADSASDAQGVPSGGAQDMAQAECRRSSGDAERRGLRVG